MAGPAVKQQRRKVSTKPKATATPKQHASSSISSFTRVSKPIAKTEAKKEERAVTLTPTKDVTIEALTPASRKRKVVASIEDSDFSADETPRKKLSFPAVKSTKTISEPAKRGRGRPSKQARPEPIPKPAPKPTPKKRARSPSVSDSDESTINTGALLKRLRLESSPSRCSSPLTASTPITDYSEIDTDNDSITPRKAGQLPKEVLDLIDLHSALLKTLTLHYAHNGSNVPADLRVLSPNVACAWGKKKVTDADIRICLGILNLDTTSSKKTNPLFSLLNYGRGKICIEIDTTQHKPGRPLDENKLNNLFRINLTSLWSQFTANGSPDPSIFSSTLPKAPVALCESVAKAAPVLAKGQKRLEELKHGIALKKQEREAKANPQHQPQQAQQKGGNADVPMTNADGSKMSLLDRIRFKSLQKAAAAQTGLSQAQLERRAALQRAAEVAACLGMLSRAGGQGGSRVSFTMATTTEKLKDSFRMGISREEGATCVRLLATDVAPEWVRVVTLAGRENVVVDMDRELSKAEVEGRVRGLLERE
ncbi:hypothetical protein F4776DRAFT_611196 [Hypoxylon sp. NC0597]|nr:hypothetical protein F4776DRAFT_611196 [Hypoxylon sp. NC0597]